MAVLQRRPSESPRGFLPYQELAGFTVRATDLEDLEPIRRDWKVPRTLASCHTAKVGGYVIEGHVPAADIRRLLEQRPRIDGLAVPGMPIGSPGMEQGGVVEAYDVLGFNAAGETRVFDIRHRFVLGGALNAKYGISFNPFVMASSGAPFNIITGRDNNGDTMFNDRPAFATDLSAPGQKSALA